jgi:hypothetical protein
VVPGCGDGVVAEGVAGLPVRGRDGWVWAIEDRWSGFRERRTGIEI